jgi:hypothetical protein
MHGQQNKNQSEFVGLSIYFMYFMHANGYLKYRTVKHVINVDQKFKKKVTGSCEYGNEPLYSIKYEELFHQLNYY